MKGADRGRGRGPCTVQVSFREDGALLKDWFDFVGTACANSRYAEPEAEGVNPVLRSRNMPQSLVTLEILKAHSIK